MSGTKFLFLFLLFLKLNTVFAQKKVLFVSSNQEYYGDTKIRTSNHFGEIVVPYDTFIKSGFTVDFVSPKGGTIPVGYINTSEAIHKQYLYDHYFMNKLKNTKKPTDVVASNYDVVFYIGGGAAMFGVAENTTIQEIARRIYNNNGIVSAICHGTAGLAYLKDDKGNSLYANKKITGFADKFEDKTEAYYKTFPFVMDEAIKSNKGNFVFSEKLNECFYVVDGRFVTGQDPSSGAKMTQEIIRMVEENNYDIPKGATEKLNQVFAEWQNEPQKPGVAGGLIKNGKLVYFNGFGSADIANGTPITPTTQFQIGAMSKHFTAFAILLLEEQGKLTLGDDIRKYLPQIPDYGHTITIKHLLSQSSGLPDFISLKEISGWREKDSFTQQDALQLLFSQKKLDYAPGTQFSQTSSGLLLLAEIVKKVAGKSLNAYCQEHIFQPLQMTNTLFKEDSDLIIPNLATSYLITKDEIKANPIYSSVTGTTNLYTSIADLSLWYLNMSNPKVGSKKMMEKFNLPVTLNDGKTTFTPTSGQLLYTQYHLHSERGIPKIWSYGLEGGYASNLFILPNQNVISFVLGNNNKYNGQPTMRMITTLLGDIFPEPDIIDFSKVKTISVDSKKLETYSGYYWDNSKSAARKVYLKEGALYYQVLGSTTESKLLPIADDIFQMVLDSDDVVKVRFKREAGKTKLIYTSADSDEYVYDNYEPKIYTSTDLNAFLGTFYCESLQTIYKLGQNEKGLFMINKNQTIIPLTSIQSDLFLSGVRAFGAVHFVRNNENKIIGFYINSDRLKNLYFEKIKN